MGVVIGRLDNPCVEWGPGEVERDMFPLDCAEDYSANLLGHDLKEFDLEY